MNPTNYYLDGLGHVSTVADQGLSVLFWIMAGVLVIAAIWVIRTRRDP